MTTTPTQATYPPPIATNTSPSTIPPPSIHSKQHPPPPSAPPPLPPPTIPPPTLPPPTSMMTSTSTPPSQLTPQPPPPLAQPSQPLQTTPWPYMQLPTTANQQPRPLAPPPGYATSASQPPQPIHMHPGPPIQHHHPHHHPSHTIYHHHHPPYPTHQYSHTIPTPIPTPIPHTHHQLQTPEYQTNASAPAPQLTQPQPPQPTQQNNTAATTAYCQRVQQLEEELTLAKREIERLTTRLAQVEKEKSTKETMTTNTSTPNTTGSMSNKTQSRYWTPDEHMRFLEALGKYGPKDVRNIASYVGTRNATQVRTHAQKYFLRVQRQAAQRGNGGGGGGVSRKRSMSESDLTKMGGKPRTPPGSPRVDDVGRELGALAGGVVGGRICKRERFGGGRKVVSPTNSSGGKPPVVGGNTGSPVVATGNGGVSASCGINLLSIVASERKEAMMSRAGGLGGSKGEVKMENRVFGTRKDTEMRDDR